MNLIKFKFKCNNNAFLLLEVAISLVIITSTSVFIASCCINMVTQHQREVKRLEALMLACNLIEKIRAGERNISVINQKINQNFKDFIINIKIEPDVDISNFSWVTVLIKYNNQENNLVLKTGVVIYEK